MSDIISPSQIRNFCLTLAEFCIILLQKISKIVQAIVASKDLDKKKAKIIHKIASYETDHFHFIDFAILSHSFGI